MTAASRNLMEKGCERIEAAIAFMSEMGQGGWAKDVEFLDTGPNECDFYFT